jgi:hypothetical protein
VTLYRYTVTATQDGQVRARTEEEARRTALSKFWRAVDTDSYTIVASAEVEEVKE